MRQTMEEKRHHVQRFFSNSGVLPDDGKTGRRQVQEFKGYGLGNSFTKAIDVEVLQSPKGLLPSTGVFKVFVNKKRPNVEGFC